MTTRLTRRDAIAATVAAGFAIMGGSLPEASGKENAIAGVWESRETRRWRDSARRRVSIPDVPKKVAPAQPLAQQFVSVINPELLATYAREPFAGQRVSAEAKTEIPITGKLHGWGSNQGNADLVSQSDAQLILSLDRASTTSSSTLDALQSCCDTPVVLVDASSTTFADAFRAAGELLGEEERCEELAIYMEKAQETLALAREQLPTGEIKTVLVAEGDDGLLTRGQGSFHSVLMDMVGARLATDSPSQGQPLIMSKDDVLTWNPDVVIFDGSEAFEQVRSGAGEVFELWKDVPAIMRGDYYHAPDGWLNFPPLQPQAIGALWLFSVLYPNACSYDIAQYAREYYTLFMGWTPCVNAVRGWVSQAKGNAWPAPVNSEQAAS